MQRIGTKVSKDAICVDAVSLVQGKMLNMIYAADIAEKAFGVR